jgi:hypothetical protein
MANEINDNERPVKVLLALPPELDREIRDAAEELGLSNQQTMRMSLERGLPILRAQLLAAVPA